PTKTRKPRKNVGFCTSRRSAETSRNVPKRALPVVNTTARKGHLSPAAQRVRSAGVIPLDAVASGSLRRIAGLRIVCQLNRDLDRVHGMATVRTGILVGSNLSAAVWAGEEEQGRFRAVRADPRRLGACCLPPLRPLQDRSQRPARHRSLTTP